DRMVINDQNACHSGRSSYEKILRGSCTCRDPSFAATARAFSNIIHVAPFAMLRARQSTCSMPVEGSPKMWAARPGRGSVRARPAVAQIGWVSHSGHDGCSLLPYLGLPKIVAKKSR